MKENKVKFREKIMFKNEINCLKRERKKSKVEKKERNEKNKIEKKKERRKIR